MPTVTDFAKALRVLQQGEVEFIIVGIAQLEALLEERKSWPYTSPDDPKS